MRVGCRGFDEQTHADAAHEPSVMNPIPDFPSGLGPRRVTASQAPGAGLASPSVMAKSVIVVEDDNGLREQLVKILNSAPGIRCVGACASGEDAIRLVPVKNPDVVLMRSEEHTSEL